MKTRSKASSLGHCYLWFVLMLLCSNAIGKEHSKLRVLTEVLPPFQYINAEGELTGYSVVITKELLKRAGIEAELEVFPWPRSYRLAEQNENVLIFSIARTKQREQNFHWIGSLFRESYSFYALDAPLTKTITQLEELKPYVIAVNRSSPNDQFLTLNEFPSIQRTADMEQTVRMFYAKRVDLLFGGILGIMEQAKNQQQDTGRLVKIFDVPELHSELFIAMSINSDPALITKLTNEYQSMIADRTIARLQNAWRLSSGDNSSD